MSGLFGRLTKLFEGAADAGADTPGLDPAATAMAALMVSLAKADGHFAAAERAAIEAALEARFGGGAKLLAAGEAAESDALDHHQFTRLVKRAYEHEERGDLLEDLWSVVLADGGRERHENALMRQFGALLHVSDRDVALARRRVEARDE